MEDFAGGETLRSQRDFTANPTILSGDIGIIGDNMDNTYSVIENLGDELDTMSVLDGFIIEKGRTSTFGGGMLIRNSSPLIRNVIFRDNMAELAGGGLFNEETSVFIDQCTFQNCNARTGGGIYNSRSNMTISNSTFINNSGENGGAMANNFNVTGLIKNCLIRDNQAKNGGGIYLFSSGITRIESNIIHSNIATISGAGIHNLDGSHPIITDCDIRGNRANNQAGGIHAFRSSPTVINTNVSGNRSSNEGGGIYLGQDAQAIFINVTIAGNQAGNRGGGLVVQRVSQPSITNCIIAKNISRLGTDVFIDISNGGDIEDGSGNLIGDTSSAAGFFPRSLLKGGPGLPLDPLFVLDVPTIGSVDGILSLRCGSSAIDAGINDSIPTNIATDLFGNSRIFNVTVDIGAVEQVEHCPEIDLVYHDGTVIMDGDTVSSLSDGTLFGEVCDTRKDSFFIINRGKAVLIIDTLELLNVETNIGIFSYDAAAFSFPLNIDPADSIKLEVTYSNGGVNRDSVMILIDHDDFDEAPFGFLISAIGDTTSPSAICKNLTVHANASGNASIVADDINNGSNDACSDVLLSTSQSIFTCANLGVNNVTLTVEDANGNSNSCTAVVTVIDTISPMAQCRNVVLYLDNNGLAALAASSIDNTSLDNCGNIDFSVSQPSFTCVDLGSNDVMLTVEDLSGNSNSCVASVNVIDSISPLALCENIDVYLNNLGLGTITAADLDNGSNDNCNVTNVSAAQTSFTCGELGANNVTLTVNDGNGNSNSCIAVVTVIDTITPSAACHNIEVYLDSDGIVSILAEDIDNGSSDACNNLNFSASKTTFACTDLGINDVVLTVSDASNNSHTCTAQVTVLDTIFTTSLLSGY